MIPLLIATLEGDAEEYTPEVYPLGRSFLRRQASRASKAVSGAVKATGGGLSVAGRVAKRGARKTGGGLSVVGRVTKRAAKTTGRVAVRAGRAIGGAVMDAGRVSKRVAKRVIRAILKPMVKRALGADELAVFGDDMAAKVKAVRPTLIAAGTTAATAAVAASGVGAPAAPAVPVLLPPILDELLDQVVRLGKKILDEDDPLEPEEVAAASKRSLPLPLILGAAGLVAFVVLRKKRNSA